MCFALDGEPKYFAKSDGLPVLVHLLVSQNYFIKPLRAVPGRRGYLTITTITNPPKYKKKKKKHLPFSLRLCLLRKLRVWDVSVTKEILLVFEGRLTECLQAAKSTHHANGQITVFVLK